MANLEAAISLRRMICNRDILETSQRRRLSLQILEESAQRALLALHLYLYVARGVAHPPLQVMFSSKLIHKGAEAHPLHHATNADAQKLQITYLDVTTPNSYYTGKRYSGEIVIAQGHLLIYYVACLYIIGSWSEIIGCGGGSLRLRTEQKLPALALVITLLLTALTLTGCSGGASNTITEAGSTTVQPVAEKLAEAYKAKNPDVAITIQGGGSSVGIKSCNDGTVDIGAASRELKSTEPNLIKHLIARDGIAIVTHPSNPVTGLTKEQVRGIFSGNITKWSQVGGQNKEIHVIAREEGSGTRTAFEEMIMGDALVKASTILLPSSGAIRTAVSSDPQAIGFISFGYIDTSVKALTINSVAATAHNASDGTYPLVRPLYFLTKTQPTGLVKEFIDFCLGTEGQSIVAEEGYIPGGQPSH
jgi:phosphate transport system substrate-binding protein